MNTVYILCRCIFEDTPWENGEYDTDILGVFDSREKAEVKAKADDLFPTKIRKEISKNEWMAENHVSTESVISVFNLYSNEDANYEDFRVTYYVKEMEVQ